MLQVTLQFYCDTISNNLKNPLSPQEVLPGVSEACMSVSEQERGLRMTQKKCFPSPALPEEQYTLCHCTRAGGRYPLRINQFNS